MIVMSFESSYVNGGHIEMECYVYMYQIKMCVDGVVECSNTPFYALKNLIILSLHRCKQWAVN